MSFDYDRLREMVEKHSPAPWAAIDKYDDGKPRPDTSRLMRGADGEYLGIMHHPDAELAALAPELARELIRLHDGVKSVRDGMADLHHAGRVYRTKKTNATIPAHSIARHLTGLLNGDAE